MSSVTPIGRVGYADRVSRPASDPAAVSNRVFAKAAKAVEKSIDMNQFLPIRDNHLLMDHSGKARDEYLESVSPLSVPQYERTWTLSLRIPGEVSDLSTPCLGFRAFGGNFASIFEAQQIRTPARPEPPVLPVSGLQRVLTL